MKQKFPTDQTKCIDDCICVYCGNKFDGNSACNANMDCTTIECPECGTEMEVSLSIEYMCTAIEE